MAVLPTEENVQAAKRAVSTGFFLAGITVGTLAPRLAEVKEATNASVAGFGTAFAVNALGALAGFYLGAQASHRFGSRSVARTIFFAMITMHFCFSQATNVYTLTAVTVMSGLVYSMFNVNMNSQGVLVEQRMGRSFLPRAHGAWSLGSLVGAMGSASVAPYISVAYTLGTVDILCGLVWLWMGQGLLKNHFEDSPQIDSSQLPKNERIPRSTLLFLYLLALGQAISMLVEGAVGDWSSVLLYEDFKIEIGPNGYAFVAFSVVHLVTRFFVPKYIDRLGMVKVLKSLSIIGISGFLAFHFAALMMREENKSITLISSCIAYGFLALGLGAMVPAFASAAGGVVGLPSARALMILGTTGAIILWIGRSTFSIFAELFSLPIAIGGLALLAFISAYLTKYLDPKFGEIKGIRANK